MKLRSVKPLLVMLLLAGAGCGYIMAGTWNDDPGNWKRAFRSSKAPEVTVTHSKYWRSPHWSYEFQYFFEIEPNDAFKKQLFGKNKLRQVTGEEAGRIKTALFGAPPAWFAPKDVTAYEIWVFEDDSDSNFKVLIDKESGAIFLNDYVV